MNWQSTNLNVTPWPTDLLLILFSAREKVTGMARGFSKTCKRERAILKLRRSLNIVFIASELEPASVSFSTFSF